MIKLTIYGDFNCPFSALASARVDVLLAAGQHEVEWRAVQHDTSLPAAGEAVVGDVAEELASEVASILELSQQDVRLHLAAPRVRSNTAAASAAFAVAGTDAHRVRRRLFAAVWAEGRDLGEPADLDRLGLPDRDATTARRWQEEFDALPNPVVPTLVLPDGYVSRGLGALAHLAELLAAADRASVTRPMPLER